MSQSDVPLQLSQLQEWFGSILKLPINEYSQLPKLSLDGKNIAEEAQKYISPSPTLKPERRLEIYFQQYWWRLLNTLQETFPTLCRMFTSRECNLKLLIPYLIDHPPAHWNLNVLGKDLPEWINKNYHEQDKEVVLTAAKLDWAFWEIFFKAKKPCFSFTEKDISKFLKRSLKLQSYLQLLQMPFDFFSFRNIFIKESEAYWIAHPFPHLSQDKEVYFFSLYRNPSGNIVWEEIEEEEWFFLHYIQQGNSIDAICKKCEKNQDSIYQEAQKYLPLWINKWVKNELFINTSQT